jgi:hypothetical protein
VRRILNERLPADRGREHQRVHGEHVEQRIKPILVEFQEANQHQEAGEQMGDVEVDPGHQKLADTKRNSVASSPSINATPRNSGTRNTRILAIDVSNRARRKPPTASLPT